MKKLAVLAALCLLLTSSSAEAWNWKSAFIGGAVASVLTGGVIGGIFAKDGADQFWPGFGMGALCAFPVGFLIGGIAGPDPDQGKDSDDQDGQETALPETDALFVMTPTAQAVALPEPCHLELVLSTETSVEGFWL